MGCEIVKTDILRVAQLSINWSYFSGGVYKFKLNFEILHLSFHTPYVTLYQSLCKNIILRGSVIVFEQIMPQLSLTFVVHLKYKNK